jgi:hypothetical protein
MAVETICRILHKDEKIRTIISPPTVCNRTDYDSSAKLSRVQLIGGTHLDQVVEALVQRIARSLVEDSLVEDPPYRYQWLRDKLADRDADMDMDTDTVEDVLVDFMTDPLRSGDQILRDLNVSLIDQQKADLLAFRGLLAHGIFVHCLKKRFRVEYGLKPDALKRMAVPYDASDAPSKRSEYAQPDCAIVLTYLSYYYDGLTDKQVCVCVCARVRESVCASV